MPLQTGGLERSISRAAVGPGTQNAATCMHCEYVARPYNTMGHWTAATSFPGQGLWLSGHAQGTCVFMPFQTGALERSFCRPKRGPGAWKQAVLDHHKTGHGTTATSFELDGRLFVRSMACELAVLLRPFSEVLVHTLVTWLQTA